MKLDKQKTLDILAGVIISIFFPAMVWVAGAVLFREVRWMLVAFVLVGLFMWAAERATSYMR